MKKLLLASAFALAPLAAQAADLSPEYNFIEDSVRSAGPQGSVLAATLEGFAGYTLWSDVSGNAADDGGSDEDYFTAGGAGRINIPLFSGISAQLDVDGEYNDVSTNAYDQFKWSVLGAGHLSWRDPSRGLVGVFGGGGTFDMALFEDNGDFWFAGAEAQAYFDRVTLYGQGGYFDGELDPGVHDPNDTFHDAWFLRGVVRYFVTDNTLLQVEGSYANGKQDTGTAIEQDMYLIGWGARAEQRLAGMPLSVFVNYEGTYYNNEDEPADEGHFMEHIITGGVSLQFGTGSLFFNDRRGTTLDVPNIARWTASGATLD